MKKSNFSAFLLIVAIASSASFVAPIFSRAYAAEQKSNCQGWNRLPSDMKLHILNFFPLVELARLETLTKECKALTTDAYRDLNTFCLDELPRGVQGDKNRVFKILQRLNFENIVKFSLRRRPEVGSTVPANRVE